MLPTPPAAVNLGGPGWMADVFDVQIILDTDLELSIAPFEGVEEDEDDPLSGADRIPVSESRVALGLVTPPPLVRQARHAHMPRMRRL